MAALLKLGIAASSFLCVYISSGINNGEVIHELEMWADKVLRLGKREMQVPGFCAWR